jgi:hypothetical protein
MMAAGRSDAGAAEPRPDDENGKGAAAFRKARTVAAGPFIRLGWAFLHMGWLVGPADEEFGAARRMNGDFVSPGDRAMVIETLQGEVDDLLDDAAGRGVDGRSADAMLLMLDILDWLRGEAEPPGWAAIELLEVRVALFNEAQGDEEREMRNATVEGPPALSLPPRVRAPSPNLRSACRRWASKATPRTPSASRRVAANGRPRGGNRAWP